MASTHASATLLHRIRGFLRQERLLVPLLLVPLVLAAFPEIAGGSFLATRAFQALWLFCLVALVLTTTIRTLRTGAQTAGPPSSPGPALERDPVTGLAPRRSFLMQLTLEETPPQEAAPGSVGSLLVVLDQPESLERRFGRTALEDAMRRTARILLHEMRPGNSCAQWNESEFVAVFPGISAERLLALAEKLRGRIQEEFRSTNHQATATLCLFHVPAAGVPAGIEASRELLARTGFEGGNRVVESDPSLLASVPSHAPG